MTLKKKKKKSKAPSEGKGWALKKAQNYLFFLTSIGFRYDRYKFHKQKKTRFSC